MHTSASVTRSYVSTSARRTVTWAALAVSAATALARAGGIAGPSTGIKPLTELPPDVYGCPTPGECSPPPVCAYSGGLYPNESNVLPLPHSNAGIARAALVVPRNSAGAPAPGGRIVMLSIGMSNTTHEFAVFERQEDLNTGRNAQVVLINGAQGGETAAIIANPNANYWSLVDARLTAMNLTKQQVQVVWLKEADGQPPSNFPCHALTLASELRLIVKNLKTRFPQLQLCYLSSRTYGGYGCCLSPESQAYESGFSVKWLIEDQIDGAPDLNFDPALGQVFAPWLAWGPYLWADGVNPRVADGLVWLQSDFENDGVHPAPSGEQKVGDLLSAFFNSEPTAASWYPVQPAALLHAIDIEADAEVRAAQPNQNFGSAPQLTVTAGTQPVYTYLRFNVAGITQPLVAAKLSLRVTTTGPVPKGTVKVVPNNSWGETTITYANAPPVSDATAGTLAQISRDGTVSVNVTSAVQAALAQGQLSLRLAATNGAGAYVSREAGQPPRLILILRNP